MTKSDFLSKLRGANIHQSIATAEWFLGTARYSKWSWLRFFFNSERFLFRRVIIPKFCFVLFWLFFSFYLERSLFRRFLSLRIIILKILIPKSHFRNKFSEQQLFKNFFRNNKPSELKPFGIKTFFGVAKEVLYRIERQIIT